MRASTRREAVYSFGRAFKYSGLSVNVGAAEGAAEEVVADATVGGGIGRCSQLGAMLDVPSNNSVRAAMRRVEFMMFVRDRANRKRAQDRTHVTRNVVQPDTRSGDVQPCEGKISNLKYHAVQVVTNR